MDNAAIDTERANLWKTMHKLEQMVHISKTLDQRLEDKANELDATEPAKAKAIRETALFYTRQRTTDLLTQMAVTVQGYLALDLVKKNNVELVKGVDRASTTTVVGASDRGHRRPGDEQPEAGARADRRAQHDDGGNDRFRRARCCAPRPARSTSRRQARPSRWRPCSARSRTSTTRWTRSTQFKLQALGNMKQTVETLGKEVEKSKGYIARAEGVNQAKLEGPAASPLAPIEAQVTEVTDKVERAIARFDRVTQQLDQRGGPAQAAARRERQRLNAGLGRTAVDHRDRRCAHLG